LVAAEAEDDDEHPRGVRDMHRLIGNHISNFKNGSKIELCKLPRSTQQEIEAHKLQILRRIREKYLHLLVSQSATESEES
jgi:nitrogen fixation protein